MPAISYDAALERIAAIAARRTASERIPLDAALGRVLAEPVVLARDQPAFDRATMDGYAVMLPGDQFTVLGTVLAGQRWTGGLLPGQAVRIMTGAPAPAGSCVVPIEHTDGGTMVMRPTGLARLEAGRNIALQGEDGRAGATVIAAGTRLAPTTLAVAAMAGAAVVDVHQPLRLAIIATGDELDGGAVAQVDDCNGPLLSAMATLLGVRHHRQRLGDSQDALRSVIDDRSVDLIVTSGGVSAGDRDLVPSVATSAGFVTIVHGIEMQPGKPVLVARHDDGRCLVGLPGNPVSVLATAHLILLPVLAQWGLPAPVAWQELPLTSPCANAGRRRLFRPARRAGTGIELVPWHGSGDLIAAGAGDGLVDLPPGANFVPGGIVRFLPYVGSLPDQAGCIPERPHRG